MQPNENNEFNDPNKQTEQGNTQNNSAIPSNDGMVHGHTPIIIQPTNQSSPNNQGQPSETVSHQITQQPQQNIEQPLPPTPHPITPISQPVTSPQTGPSPLPFPPKKSRKPLLFGGIAGILLILGSLGFVFGYYVPNRPENVWKTGLERTGDEVQATIEKLADPATFDELTKNTLSIDGELTSEGGTYTLAFDSKFDQTKTDNVLNITMSGDGMPQDINVTANVKTSIVEDSVLPNIYFKIIGLQSLGADYYIPGISEYEDKWIAVEQDYYNKNFSDLISNQNSDEATNQNVTQQDLVSIIESLSSVTDEYLFTADPDKAVLQLDEFVGEEESRGITAYHYKTSINVANASAMCHALADALVDSEPYRNLIDLDDNDIEDARTRLKDDCEYTEQQADEINSFDLWIDKKYKLFHKVRVYENLEEKNTEYRRQQTECQEKYQNIDAQGIDTSSFCNVYDDIIETGERYTEFGQVYNGDDQINLFMSSINDTNRQSNSTSVDLTIDIDSLLYKGSIVYEDTSSENGIKGRMTIDTEPYDGEIDANRPANAIDLQTVMEELTAKLQQRSRSNQFQFEELGVNTDGSLQNNQQNKVIEALLELVDSYSF